MRFVFPYILGAVLAVVLSSPAGAQQPPTLEERLSEAQFRSFGLDKLTPEELAAFNRWLGGDVAARVAAAAPVADQDRSLGFRPKPTDRDEVQARLVGTFSGWSGSTIFKLDNGQEWQQVEPGAYDGQRIENAEVTVKPKSFGSWLLVVEHCQCRVAVKRIK
ncbi:MAG: hypothetical protein J0L88_12190 [Xanthomonadales bacterium]|nr:hypothetical protein [Xanthomonadales bacterium]